MSAAQLAEAVARDAFVDITDQAGRPYVTHLERVAERVQGDWTKAVAWLHDIIEDTEHTPETLAAAGVGPVVIEAVELLTHQPNEPYRSYVDRIVRHGAITKAGDLALRVKVADLCDNLDVRRALLDHGTECRLRAKHQPALDRILHGRWLDEPLL